jgi:hypothetical protein
VGPHRYTHTSICPVETTEKKQSGGGLLLDRIIRDNWQTLFGGWLKELMDEDISGIMYFFLKISGVVDDKTNNNNNRRPATAKWIDSERRRRRRQRRRLGRIKCHAKPLAPLLAFDWEQPKARVIINVPKKEKKIKEKIFRANGGAPIASKKIKEKGGGIFLFSFFFLAGDTIVCTCMYI